MPLMTNANVAAMSLKMCHCAGYTFLNLISVSVFLHNKMFLELMLACHRALGHPRFPYDNFAFFFFKKGGYIDRSAH